MAAESCKEFKSPLSFDGIVRMVREVGKTFQDKRNGKNIQFTMSDVVLSAFSVFYMQCPSFLSYQQDMESERNNNNARTLFGIERIPSDNHIRDLLDETEPKQLYPVFEAVFAELAKTQHFDRLRGNLGDLLMAFDGVEHHRSHRVHCPHCKMTHHANGQTSYAHRMVTAALVKPDCPHVINLPPEFIVPQDGHDKQDSEQAAFKRWIAAHAERYQPYGMTVLGDDLYSCQPICEVILNANLHFILTCKQKSHKTLYEYVEGLRQTDRLQVVEVSRWTGKRRVFDQYCYTHQVPIRDGDDAQLVNWCELMTTDSDGKVLYSTAFITDHTICDSNVADLVQDGRARWKTENENNNTLKCHGYHLDRNFGHGQSQLSNVLVTLNLLSFLTHTILAMTSEPYQKVRKKLGARKKFFDHIRTLTHYLLFTSWDAMLHFMMEKLELIPDTS